MTEAEHWAYRQLTDTHCTRHITDRVVQAMLIRSAKTPQDRKQIIRWIMDANARWLDWTARTQRDWQARVARRVSHQRNHDSWATREAYVRCYGSYSDYMELSREIKAHP